MGSHVVIGLVRRYVALVRRDCAGHADPGARVYLNISDALFRKKCLAY